VQSGTLLASNLLPDFGSGKELIMAMNNTNMNLKSVMGFSFYCYFKACYFAGLFCCAVKTPLSGL
jgi:hypothetical protein